MNLTITQGTNPFKISYGSFFSHVLYLDPRKESFVFNHNQYPNFFDYELMEDRTEGSAVLEITFDKDYEVDNVKPSDYYAHVPSWLVRLLTSRSRNRQEEIE